MQRAMWGALVHAHSPCTKAKALLQRSGFESDLWAFAACHSLALCHCFLIYFQLCPEYINAPQNNTKYTEHGQTSFLATIFVTGLRVSSHDRLYFDTAVL